MYLNVRRAENRTVGSVTVGMATGATGHYTTTTMPSGLVGGTIYPSPPHIRGTKNKLRKDACGYCGWNEAA